MNLADRETYMLQVADNYERLNNLELPSGWSQASPEDKFGMTMNAIQMLQHKEGFETGVEESDAQYTKDYAESRSKGIQQYYEKSISSRTKGEYESNQNRVIKWAVE